MTTSMQTVKAPNGKEVRVAIAPGEKLVNAKQALEAVLRGKVIRPHYHDNKLQVKYVRGLGLAWEGETAIVAKTLVKPDYLWDALNKNPDSLWIIPGQDSQRGKWFDGTTGKHVALSNLTDEHLANAQSWLSLKTSELKSEAKRREKVKEDAVKAEKKSAAALASKAKKEAKRQARRDKYQAKSVPKGRTGTYTEALKAMALKGAGIVPEGFANSYNDGVSPELRGMYSLKNGVLCWRGQGPVNQASEAEVFNPSDNQDWRIYE